MKRVERHRLLMWDLVLIYSGGYSKAIFPELKPPMLVGPFGHKIMNGVHWCKTPLQNLCAPVSYTG